MKKHYLLPAILLILAACVSKPKEQEVILPATETRLWDADLDSAGNLNMKQVLVPEMDSVTAGTMLSYINSNNSRIKLDLDKISGDTLKLKIADAEYLTQQMGSTGAEMYLAKVVYNCTEIPGIHFVRIDFEEGDHAQPGTYKREDFK